jgi:hypothetical protein
MVGPGSFSQVELGDSPPPTLCLQSMAKMSSTVQGLAWSVPSVHLSTATSRRAGVGGGCHPGRYAQSAAAPDLDVDRRVCSRIPLR